MFLSANEHLRRLYDVARESGFIEGRMSDRLRLAYLLLADVAGRWELGAGERYLEEGVKHFV